jgi:hypothetical protein
MPNISQYQTPRQYARKRGLNGRWKQYLCFLPSPANLRAVNLKSSVISIYVQRGGVGAFYYRFADLDDSICLRQNVYCPIPVIPSISPISNSGPPKDRNTSTTQQAVGRVGEGATGNETRSTESSSRVSRILYKSGPNKSTSS